MKSEHPGADILKSTLKDFQSMKQQEQQQSGISSSDQQLQQQEGGAQTLFLPMALKAVSFAMNAVNGIGTYSDSLSKASQFLAGPVAQKLSQLGFSKAASLAQRSGQKMDQFVTQILKPFEDKIAQKIAPIVKSKTFQNVNNALNVVTSAMSLKGGLKALGMVSKIKLPSGALAKARSALKMAINAVKNRREIMNMIKQNPEHALNQFNKIKSRVERVQGQWEDFKGQMRNFKDGLMNRNNNQQDQQNAMPITSSTQPSRNHRNSRSGFNSQQQQRASTRNHSQPQRRRSKGTQSSRYRGNNRRSLGQIRRNGNKRRNGTRNNGGRPQRSLNNRRTSPSSQQPLRGRNNQVNRRRINNNSSLKNRSNSSARRRTTNSKTSSNG